MGINFPAAPAVGQKYPTPAVVGVPTYTWDGEKWVTKADAIGSFYVRIAGETMTGPLVLPAAPTLDLQASTKKYVDDKFAGVPAGPGAATAAEYRANTGAGKFLSPDQVWLAAALVVLTDAATVAPDFNLGFDFSWSIGAIGRTLANPTNIKVGQKGIITLAQGVAGATITTWGSSWRFAGGTKPVLSTAINSIDILSYVCVTSTFVACTFSADFK